jgi:hypothetical protein
LHDGIHSTVAAVSKDEQTVVAAKQVISSLTGGEKGGSEGGSPKLAHMADTIRSAMAAVVQDDQTVGAAKSVVNSILERGGEQGAMVASAMRSALLAASNDQQTVLAAKQVASGSPNAAHMADAVRRAMAAATQDQQATAAAKQAMSSLLERKEDAAGECEGTSEVTQKFGMRDALRTAVEAVTQDQQAVIAAKQAMNSLLGTPTKSNGGDESDSTNSMSATPIADALNRTVDVMRNDQQTRSAVKEAVIATGKRILGDR